MTSTRSDLIDLTLQLHHETERAILVSDDGSPDRAVWLAKALIEAAPARVGQLIEVTMPEWLAIERKLVGCAPPSPL